MAGPTWIERRVDLRWHDADQLGHVNHTLYLSFMSEARDRLGVTARSSLLRVGTSSIRTADEVVRPDGVVAARAEAVTVVTDRVAVRSRPFTPAERAALEALL